MTDNDCMCDIFISYRRKTGRDRARTLQLELERRGYRVFFDYDSIRDGEFDDKIFTAIENCRIFIVFYSEHSLDNCFKEDDWVRIELEYALSLRKKIVPVIPSDLYAKWEFPSSLPHSLAKLPNYQISEVSMESLFRASVDELVKERLAGISTYTFRKNLNYICQVTDKRSDAALWERFLSYFDKHRDLFLSVSVILAVIAFVGVPVYIIASKILAQYIIFD